MIERLFMLIACGGLNYSNFLLNFPFQIWSEENFVSSLTYKLNW